MTLTARKLQNIIYHIAEMEGNEDAVIKFVCKSFMLDEDIRKIKETNYATTESNRIDNITIKFRKLGNRITITTE